jgi:hypothetical protein
VDILAKAKDKIGYKNFFWKYMKKRGGVKYFYRFYHSRACEAIQSLQVIHFVPVILSFAKNPEFPQCYFPVLFIIEKYQKLLLSCLLVLHSVLDLFLEIRKTPPDGRQTVPNFYKNFVDRNIKTHKNKEAKQMERVSIQTIPQSILFLLSCFLREREVIRRELFALL